MKAAVWYGEKDLRIEDRDLKPMKADEVKVRVAWAGICGSDLHEYQEGPVFIPVDKEDELTGEVAPLIMGHEFAGVIEEIGSEVTKYKVGDRVAINPTLTHGNLPEALDTYDGFSFIGLHMETVVLRSLQTLLKNKCINYQNHCHFKMVHLWNQWLLLYKQ